MDTGLRRGDRLALILLFGVYLVMLAWIILFKLHLPFIGRDDMREIKLIPFLPSATYGASSPLEVVENLLLFVPFGVYLRALAPWNPRVVVAVILVSSVALEATQFALALGSSDLTDVIVNTGGGVVGVVLYGRLRQRLGTNTRAVLTDAFAFGTLLALLVAGAIIAFLPHLNVPPGTVILQ